MKGVLILPKCGGHFADSAFRKEFCISKCVTADACASINPEVAVVLVGVGWTWGI